MAESIVVKFCTQVGYVKFQHTNDKSPLKERAQGHVTLNFGAQMVSLERFRL